MKTFILLILTMFLFSPNSYSQMQKGDKSLGFQAYVSIVENSTSGSVLGSFSYNISDKIRLTMAPSITIQSSPTYKSTGTAQPKIENEVTVSFGSSYTGEYYFSNKSKLSFFVLLGLYWPDFGESNKAFITGPGLNYFISKNVSWKTNLQFGLMFVPGVKVTGSTVATESSSTFLTLLTTGLDFRF